jgi:hypothetical protein
MNKQTADAENLSAQIVEWDNQIELLKDQAKSDTAGVKSENAGAIAALQLKRDQAALKLQGIARTSDEKWEDVKTGSEDVLDEVKGLIKDTITQIK